MFRLIGRSRLTHRRITAHCLRHACADLIGEQRGVHVTQHFLRHEEISTTQVYLSRLSPDRLSAAVEGVILGVPGLIGHLSGVERPAIPVKATTGLEPV
jgi:integrase